MSQTHDHAQVVISDTEYHVHVSMATSCAWFESVDKDGYADFEYYSLSAQEVRQLIEAVCEMDEDANVKVSVYGGKPRQMFDGPAHRYLLALSETDLDAGRTAPA